MNNEPGSVLQSDMKKGTFSGVLRGCFTAVLAAFLICTLAVVAVVGFMVVGAVMQVGAPRRVVPVGLREVHLSGPVKGPKIAVVNIEGLIYGGSTPSAQMTPVALLSAKLRRARLDPEVKGVLLLVDSAGGGITGSDVLHNKLKELRDRPDAVPVVASILNVGASGAYYGICGVDRIIAHPTALTGSIGVLMPLYDATELMRKIGVREDSILSGEYKDLGSPFSERTEEERRRQRELLEDIVRSMHERFVEIVAESRGLEVDDVRALADGRIMTAADALEAGLIDDIGYENDAVAILSEKTGLKDPRIVQYRREITLGTFISSLLRARGSVLDLLPILDKNAVRPTPRPMYLWTAGE